MDMSSTSNPFRHQPLSGNEIRLISIVDGQYDEDISCKLEHAELNPDLQYVALSYVWGDENNRVLVSINDQGYYVTRNLYHFLRQLRYFIRSGDFEEKFGVDSPLPCFWLDAICINQSDLSEKAEQIPRMGEIYRSALSVIGFLGLEETINEQEVDFFFDEANKFFESTRDDETETGFIHYPLAELLGETLKTFTKTLSKIIQRPWFERVWILQEAALAKTYVICILGKRTLRFDVLAALWQLCDHINSTGTEEFPETIRLLDHHGPARLLLICQTHKMFATRPRAESRLSEEELFAERLLQTIVQVSYGSRACQAKEAHDMIYALLAIASAPTLPATLSPDYRRSYSEICYDYSRFVIENTRDLTLLCAKTWISGNSTPQTPTWLPDFRKLSHVKKRPGTLACATFSTDRMKMSLEGTVLGRCIDTQEAAVDKYRDNDLPDERIFKDFDKRIIQQACSRRDAPYSRIWSSWLRLFKKISFGTPSIDNNQETAWIAYGFLKDGTIDNAALTAYDNKTIPTIEQLHHAIVMLRAQLYSCSHAVTDEGDVVSLYMKGRVILPGDLVCAFKGSAYPTILRPRGSAYEYVGKADITIKEVQDDITERFFWSRTVETFTLV